MKKLIKLGILLVISLSVYFIYKKTSNATYQITSIGDQLAEGINSYGIKEVSYIDYLKIKLESQKENVEVNREYETKDQTIKNIYQLLKTTPNIKKTISETDLLILTLGYNDLIYAMAIEEELNEAKQTKLLKEIEENYQNLIHEIKKYYHEEIIVVGYLPNNTDDFYKIKGIKQLNSILESEKITYINTYNLLLPRDKYFSNPSNYYPNHKGYYRISKEIIKKTLEIP